MAGIDFEKMIKQQNAAAQARRESGSVPHGELAPPPRADGKKLGWGVKLLVTLLVVALAVSVSEGRIKPQGAIGLGFVIFLAWASCRSASKIADRTTSQDSDSVEEVDAEATDGEESDGEEVDWETKEIMGQEVLAWGSLLLMVPDIAVFEADAICRKLAEAGVRFKLDQIEHCQGFTRFGHGGLDSRMCIWVEEEDYAKARPIVDCMLKITV